MNLRTAAAAMAMLATGSADAPWAGEFALPPADSGFALGWISAAGDMREFVPRGETVDRWTRMITVQQSGWRVGLTPASWLERWLTRMRGACPAGAATTIAAAPLGDHAGAQAGFACPRNPATGLPESVAARMVLGDQGLQMVQAAARRAFTADDRRWAAAVVGGMALCAPSTAAAAAPRCAAAREAAPGSPL